MRILAVDPGYEVSAIVLFDGARGRVLEHVIEQNILIAEKFRRCWPTSEPLDAVVFESIESYGMAVGREVFETVFWTGRFFEAASAFVDQHRMPRRTVKVHLCQSARAQDSNIRVALLDRFGGKDKAIGRKSQPGPLFGIKSHEWAALAIAVTWWDLNQSIRKDVPA